MAYLKKFDKTQLTSLLNFRNNEIKIGERINYPNEDQTIEAFISETESEFIVFGIAEDFGVIANGGIAGTKSAWNEFVKNFVNIQNNSFLKGKSIAIIGHFEFENILNLDKKFSIKNAENLQLLYEAVSKIDKEISYIVSLICKHKKIPIIIGGGHNNSYGNIKGLSLAKNKPVHVVNFDAHTDFRNLEGRHSGNGFSYAYDHGFLKRYFIFGVHENYLSKSILKNIENTNGNVVFNTYEEIAIREDKTFNSELKKALHHVESDFFGIEIDMDSIPNIPASAQTPSGFGLEKARKFVHYFGQHKKASYLHICEAAPDLSPIETRSLTAKAMVYLVTDFIKAKLKTFIV